VVLILTVALAAVAVIVLDLDVSPARAAMFIFYYAVLSEVSPPTALAAVAAAAITGGDVMRTMWQTCKYRLPAFLVPMTFVLTPAGSALLGQGSLVRILGVTFVAAVGVAALAVVTGGWVLHRAGLPERVLCLCAALFPALSPATVRGDRLRSAGRRARCHVVGERSFGAKPSQSTGTG